MAWPRIKNPRSSAPPGTHEHGSVTVTVMPAPEADAAPKTGQNTGISGTRHAVVDGPSTSARNVYTQYADSGADGYAPTAEFDAVSDPAADEPPDSGIAILEGVVTTDIPVEEPRGPQPQLNEPITLPPVPVGWVPESKQGSLRAVNGGSGAAAGNGGAPVASGGAPAGSTGTPATAGGPSGGGRAIGGNGPPPQRIRDLALDQRIRLWRWRALIMVIVGVVFWIITRNWAIVLSLAVLAGIIDTIYRSRTVADIPTGGSPDRAQRRTRRQLRRMRRAGYLTLHARPIPDSVEVIDHLVVGPTGVYAIDSEKWHRALPIRTRNGKQLWHGPDSKKERLEHARWEAQQASERLSAALGTEIPVRPAMAVYGPRVPWDIATIRDVDVFSGPRLGAYLRRRARSKTVPRLTREQVQTIYAAASSVLPGVAPARTATPVG